MSPGPMNAGPAPPLQPQGQPQYHCTICQIDMFTANIGSHLAGKKHLSRCAVVNGEPRNNNSTEPMTLPQATLKTSAVNVVIDSAPASLYATNPSIIDAEPHPKFHCELCQLTINLIDKNTHLAGKYHQRKVAAAGFQTAPETSSQVPTRISNIDPSTALPHHPVIFCSLCQCSMSAIEKDHHLAGKKHQEAQRATTEYQMQEIVFCGFCKAPVLGTVKEHTGTAVHKRAMETAMPGMRVVGPGNGQQHLQGLEHAEAVGWKVVVEDKKDIAGTGDQESKGVSTTPLQTTYCDYCKDEMREGIEKHMAKKLHWIAVRRAKRAALASNQIKQPELVGLNPTATACIPPLGATKPSPTNPSTTYYCDICSRNVFTSLRQQHLTGKLHAQGMAAAKNRVWWEGVLVAREEELKPKVHGSKPAPAVPVTESGTIAAEATAASSKGGGVQGSLNIGDKSLAALRVEHVSGSDATSFTTATEPLQARQRDSFAPPDAFTLQSKSSTARIYCDACERQLNTSSGFAAHMKGKTHRRIMETKITSGQKQANVPTEAVTREAVTKDVSYAFVGRKESAQQTRPLLPPRCTYHFHGSLESYLQKPAMQLHLNPLPTGQEPKPRLVPKQLQKPTIPEELAAMFYCSACDKYLNVDRREQHLNSQLHIDQALSSSQIPISGARPEAIVPPPAVQETPTDFAPRGLTMDESTPASPAPRIVPADSFHCITCDRTRKLIGYTTHMKCKSHRKALLQPSPVSTAIQNPALPSIPKSEFGPETWLCKACKIYLHLDVRESHLASTEHIVEARGQPNSLQKPKNIFSPITAPHGDTFPPSPTHGGGKLEDMDSHQATAEDLFVNDPRPKEKLAARKAVNEADEIWYCDVCGQDINAKAREWHLSPGWYCGVCQGMVHEDWRDDHLRLPAHSKRQSEETPAVVDIESRVDGVRASTPPLSGDTHNANYCIPCNKQFKDISAHLLCKGHPQRLPNYQPPPGRLYCSICSQEYPEAAQEIHETPAWDCVLCGTRTHTRFRKAHEEGGGHIRRVAARLTSRGEDHVEDTHLDVTVPEDTAYCALCNTTPKNMVHHVRTQKHRIKMPDYKPKEGKLFCESCKREHSFGKRYLHMTAAWGCEVCGVTIHEGEKERHLKGAKHAKRTAKMEKMERGDRVATVESEHDGSRNDSKGVGGEEDSGGEESGVERAALERLNRLVRRQALKMNMPANSELCVTTEMEPELWYCSLCDMDIPPAMRNAHEAQSWHVSRLELMKQEAGDGKEQETSAPSLKPTNPKITSFRCLICSTTYGPSDRQLHSTPPWHCQTCDIIIHTDAKPDHLSTASHRLKESAPSEKGAERTFTPASKDTFFCLPCRRNIPKSDRKFHYSPPYYCALCELVMHTDTRDIHEWSLSHTRAVAAATARGVKKSERFNCQTCKKNFPIAVQPFHRSRAWMCELCEVTVHMDWIGAHLVSDRHVEKEKEEDGVKRDVGKGGYDAGV